MFKLFLKKTILLVSIACLSAAILFLFSTAFAGKQKAVYVGMDKCKECHPEHVKTYSEWKYSKNFRILEMSGKDHDPQCLYCHTTGYGKEGGFISVEKTPHMKNIQCEACHGPASLHIKAPTVQEHLKTLSIPKNVCTTCHHQHKHMGF